MQQPLGTRWRISALALLLPAAALVAVPVGAQITNGANAVNTNHIADNAVGSSQIATNSVGSAQIASNSVDSSQLADNAIGSAQIANNSLNLFAGLYAGGPSGQQAANFIIPDNASLAPTDLGCMSFRFFFSFARTFICSGVNLPFNGTGAFNGARVLEDDAIDSDKLTRAAIGYQDYVRNLAVFDGVLGDSHYADNGLNSSVLPDGLVNDARLNTLLVSLGRPALANTLQTVLNAGINADLLVANAVVTAGLADNAVTTAKFAADVVINTGLLADGAVTSADFADNAVTPAKFVADLVITTDKLADNAVTAADFADNVIFRTIKFADLAVFGEDFADGAITTAKLEDDAVTSAGFADNAVTAAKLVDDSITTGKLANNAVFSADFANGAVTTAKLVDSAVTSADFADNAVTAAKIVDASITTAKLADNAVFSADFADGAVTTAKLVDGAVTSADFADNAVTAAKIVDNAVNSAKIADRSITGVDFARDLFTSDYLTEGAVDSEAVLDGSVGVAKLDIRVINDFDVILGSGQQSIADAVAIATGFADDGRVTSASGAVIATISSEDQARIRQIVASFQSSGVIASSHAAFAELSADVALRIGGLFGGSQLALQQVGNRNDSVGSDWTASTIRGQTNWLRERSAEVGERVDFSHQRLNRLLGEVAALDRGVAMASSVGATYVQRGRRASIDITMSTFGDKDGIALGAGFRVSRDTQLNVAASATEDMDDYIVRFGASTQY